MKSMLLTAVAFTSCGVVTADADDGSAADAVSGVWSGTWRPEGGSGPGSFGVTFGSSRGPTLYVLDLSVTDDEVEGTLAVGTGTDRRTARERAMNTLGLPGNEGPAMPRPLQIMGTVDDETLVVETTSSSDRPYSMMGKVSGNRMRAEVRSGRDTRVVWLRRCRPSRNETADDCALSALWAEHLETSGRKTPRALTSEEIQRIVQPLGDPNGLDGP